MLLKIVIYGKNNTTAFINGLCFNGRQKKPGPERE
jgi:hypothetical protein